jgi:hypothetical protein
MMHERCATRTSRCLHPTPRPLHGPSQSFSELQGVPTLPKSSRIGSPAQHHQHCPPSTARCSARSPAQPAAARGSQHDASRTEPPASEARCHQHHAHTLHSCRRTHAASLALEIGSEPEPFFPQSRGQHPAPDAAAPAAAPATRPPTCSSSGGTPPTSQPAEQRQSSTHFGSSCIHMHALLFNGRAPGKTSLFHESALPLAEGVQPARWPTMAGAATHTSH